MPSEQEIRTKFIQDAARHLTEDEALILTHLLKIRKVNNENCSVASVSKALKIAQCNVRVALGRMEVPNFVLKGKEKRKFVYSITQDGVTALNFLMDAKIYPGRRAKIMGVVGKF